MSFLEKILFVLSVFSISCIFLQLLSLTVLLKLTSQAKNQATRSTYRPFVSILKPVRGMDSGGYENFKSFCRLNYPHYELIFGVSEINDPVIEEINQLRKEFPHIPIQLALSSKEIGPNPKVNNLANAYELSHGEVIVISDSDVRAEPDYLQHAISPLENRKIGLVTAVVMASGAKDFWSGLHALIVNGGIGSIFSLLYQLGNLDMGYGPSIAMRREVLEEIGGFHTVSDYAGEDIFIGRIVKKRGYQVHLQSQIVKVFKEHSSWLKQYDLILRWLIVVGRHVPVFTFVIPIFFTIQMTLLNLILFHNLEGLLLFGIALISRMTFMTVMTLWFVREHNLLKYLWGATWGELCFSYLWFKSIYSNRILWRGRWYGVYSSGRMERLEGLEEKDVALMGEAA